MAPAKTKPTAEAVNAVPDAATEHAMRLAMAQAHNAWLVGEVPVGAVIMRDGQVIATGYNRPITGHDPTAHAEIVACATPRNCWATTGCPSANSSSRWSLARCVRWP
jgi:tRNA(adenine34) deaminase